MNNIFKVGNLNTKVFKYKGQMINYYKKLELNKNYKIITCGFSMKYGYICQWA